MILDKEALSKDIQKKLDNFGNEIKEIRKDLFELKTKEIPDLKNDILSDIQKFSS